MKDLIIQNYIASIKEEDVVMFAQNNGIMLSTDEVDILYRELKKHWRTILYGDPTSIFQNLKEKIRPATYNKGIELFYAMKQKYQSFL